MTMRGVFGLAASFVAGIAGVVANQDGDSSIVPFFVGLTFFGGVVAWAAHPPYADLRRALARIAAGVWLVAGIWIAILLIMFHGVGDGPTPPPEQTYLGLTATIYHLVGMYAGLGLVLIAAFAPEHRFGRTTSAFGSRVDDEPAQPRDPEEPRVV
jgi:hypothetical protein